MNKDDVACRQKNIKRFKGKDFRCSLVVRCPIISNLETAQN